MNIIQDLNLVQMEFVVTNPGEQAPKLFFTWLSVELWAVTGFPDKTLLLLWMTTGTMIFIELLGIDWTLPYTRDQLCFKF